MYATDATALSKGIAAPLKIIFDFFLLLFLHSLRSLWLFLNRVSCGKLAVRARRD